MCFTLPRHLQLIKIHHLPICYLRLHIVENQRGNYSLSTPLSKNDTGNFAKGQHVGSVLHDGELLCCVRHGKCVACRLAQIPNI
jgi:hypothetical protein